MDIVVPETLNKASVKAFVRKLVQENRTEILESAVFSRVPEEPYGRKVLFQDNRLELLLTAWWPGFFCWPHTHGPEAKGMVLVISGEGTFNTFPTENTSSRNTTTLAEDKTIFVPDGEIHCMGNASNQKLICLHAYWPAISEMNVYDPGMKKCWRVSDGGAWKPAEKFILEERIVNHGV